MGLHPMTTRSRVGTFQPNPRYAGVSTTTAVSPIPNTVHAALKDQNWRAAMQAEFDALQVIKLGSWFLGPPVPMS